MDRREFATLASGGLTSSLLGPLSERYWVTEATKSKIKAIAFDAFPIFDPRPVFALAEELYPGKGSILSEEWRVRQFEYTWLRTAARRYTDFWHVSQDALVFAANKVNLQLTPEKREKLMNAYLELAVWPDVQPALNQLKRAGFRLVFLSNLTSGMLAANVKCAGLDGLFELALSTDLAKTYKPDPRGYQLGVDALELKRKEILFAAFAGWDAAGAKLFGYPTFWVNRLKLPAEELGAVPDASGDSLTQLVQFLASMPGRHDGDAVFTGRQNDRRLS
jgi:2-haloacid dehalogenase